MTNSPGVDSGGRWGLVLLAHGSQRGASRDECSCGWRELSTPAWCLHCPSTPDGLRQAARRVQDLLGVDDEQIVLSCLEFIQPFPDEAVKLLHRRGFQKVVVMPFLLGSGKHATMELDEFLDDVRGQLPGMELRLADGLGADPRLAELVAQRVRGLEGGAPTNGSLPKGVLLVKAGTKTQYDDCIWLEELGGMVEKHLGSGYAVAVAQSHYGDPTMDYAASRLVESRNVASITCVPYLFFPGMILRRNVLGGLDQIQDRYPEVAISITPPLGVDDRVAATAAERVRQAWGPVPS